MVRLFSCFPAWRRFCRQQPHFTASLRTQSKKECVCKLVDKGEATPKILTDDPKPEKAQSKNPFLFRCGCDFEGGDLAISQNERVECQCSSISCECERSCQCSSADQSSGSSASSNSSLVEEGSPKHGARQEQEMEQMTMSEGRFEN